MHLKILIKSRYSFPTTNEEYNWMNCSFLRTRKKNEIIFLFQKEEGYCRAHNIIIVIIVGCFVFDIIIHRPLHRPLHLQLSSSYLCIKKLYPWMQKIYIYTVSQPYIHINYRSFVRRGCNRWRWRRRLRLWYDDDDGDECLKCMHSFVVVVFRIVLDVSAMYGCVCVCVCVGWGVCTWFVVAFSATVTNSLTFLLQLFLFFIPYTTL